MTPGVDQINSVRANRTPDNATRRDRTPGTTIPSSAKIDHTSEVDQTNSVRADHTPDNATRENHTPELGQINSVKENHTSDKGINIDHGSDEPQQKNKSNPILRLKKSKMSPRTNHSKDSRRKGEETIPNGWKKNHPKCSKNNDEETIPNGWRQIRKQPISLHHDEKI